MKRVIYGLILVLLSGCHANRDSLEQWYKQKVPATDGSPETPLIPEEKFESTPSVRFYGEGAFPLFFSPSRQAQYQDNNKAECNTLTDSRFAQQESERLAALMRFKGYLSAKQGKWALIESQYGGYFRLKEGEQLLNEPYSLKVINGQKMLVTGKVPDQYGCTQSVTLILGLNSERN